MSFVLIFCKKIKFFISADADAVIAEVFQKSLPGVFRKLF